MIKDNQKYLNRFHVVIDGCVIAVSYVAAWFIQFWLLEDPDIGKLPVETYMSALIPLIPGLLLLYYAFSLYTPKRVQGRRLEFGNIMKANSIALLLFILILYMIHENDFSRKMLFIFYGLNIAIEILVRYFIRKVLMNMRAKGLNLKHIILVGYSRAAEEFVDRVKENPQWGYLIRDDAFRKSIEHFITIVNDATRREKNYREIVMQAELVDEFKKLVKSSF